MFYIFILGHNDAMKNPSLIDLFHLGKVGKNCRCFAFEIQRHLVFFDELYLTMKYG
jgi:hypothetical protein